MLSGHDGRILRERKKEKEKRFYTGIVQHLNGCTARRGKLQGKSDGYASLWEIEGAMLRLKTSTMKIRAS